jgi:hypothetical protein
MIDIESLGTELGCVIISIGAVRFGLDGPAEECSVSVSMTDTQREGLEINAETLEWWLTQDAAARKQLRGGAELEQALLTLTSFVSGVDEIWANSPKFDAGILEAAYDAVGLEVPWEYYDLRDYRTLANLPVAPELEQDGVGHNALDDARHQARVAAATLERLNAVTEVSDE